jgi:hypothetical protein
MAGELTDLQRMKTGTWSQKQINVSGAFTAAVEYNRNRVALIISTDGGQTFVISREVAPTGAGGIFFTANPGFAEFTLIKHGAIVHGPMFIKGSIGGVALTIWEAVLDRD